MSRRAQRQAVCMARQQRHALATTYGLHEEHEVVPSPAIVISRVMVEELAQDEELMDWVYAEGQARLFGRGPMR